MMLHHKYEELAKLSKKLAGSLMIKSIWNDAFENNCTCTLFCHTKWPHSKPKDITRQYLQRSDGTQFDITLEEYQKLMEFEHGQPSIPTQRRYKSL